MIKAFDIAHPEDLKATQILRSIPGIESICRKVMEVGYERILRGENLAMMLKVSEKCMPDVLSLMRQTVSAVGIDMPEVYIYNDPVMNAYTYGETKTFVCISSSCIEKLDKNELQCLMAHECGHILCQHVLYGSVFDVIRNLGERLGLLSYGLSGPAFLALQYWSRRGELSADRCAAVVSGERVFQSTILKIASGLSDIGSDPYQLVRQANEFHEHERRTLLDKIQQNCRMAFYSHPQMVNRAYEIYRWKKSYVYRSLRSEI